ncbi:STAS domain-containing protein [Niallia taxi]|uniref:STAS domain-containing protein n=2 Tax=Bacillati TaxID=1783272 RepID=A0A3S2UCL4_9BACI|nr:STAS domain-containing protein [Niallia taxi]RVT57213.1 STAS domain-containing protein [Niallia taxi]
MDSNKLYTFFLDKTWDLTEDWYANVSKNDSSGVYASSEPEVIKTVKQQNYEFHLHFAEIFNQDRETYVQEFEQWVLKVAQDEEHSSTPIQFIIREFHSTQKQYLDLVNDYLENNSSKYTLKDIHSLYNLVVETMSQVIEWFTIEYNKNAENRLFSQQELILELSTPVITLNNKVALLPLVGEIDTARAKILLERTLEECSRLRTEHLLLDFSGVVVIDTMVAHQIFQLLDALSLIGVKTHLSGIRPEVAQTAIQLGLKFKDISITSSLAHAINRLEYID